MGLFSSLLSQELRVCFGVFGVVDTYWDLSCVLLIARSGDGLQLILNTQATTTTVLTTAAMELLEHTEAQWRLK